MTQLKPPPPPTSSQVSTLTNAVRIEKLSDDEDEDVDITDDLGDDEGEGHKPQAVLDNDFCGPEEKTESGTQSPREEHKHGSLSGIESIREPKDEPSYSSFSPQSLQPPSSPDCSDDPGVTEQGEKVNKTASVFPQSHHTPPTTDSNQMFAAGAGRPEEAYSDGTGNSLLLFFTYLPLGHNTLITHIHNVHSPPRFC